MKKLAAVVALCLLAGCSSKETIEVDYVHPNHNEIAEQVGYNSSQYFAVCFKKYTGISPGAYRDQI